MFISCLVKNKFAYTKMKKKKNQQNKRSKKIDYFPLPFVKLFPLGKTDWADSVGERKSREQEFTPKVMDHVELSNLGEKSPNCFIAVLSEPNCTSPAEEHRHIRSPHSLHIWAGKLGKWEGKQTGREAGMLNCISVIKSEEKICSTLVCSIQ